MNSDWQPMGSAPRDGTVVEIRCTYGVAPWYGVYKFAEHRYGNGGPGGWVDAKEPRKSFDEGPTFNWRSYNGALDTYVDPTGGRQDDPAYWRAAVAAKHGLPPDYFEKKWWQFWK